MCCCRSSTPEGCSRRDLLDQAAEVRRKSLGAYKRMLEFAGYFRAKVGRGIARGKEVTRASCEEPDRLTEDVFRELSDHAEAVTRRPGLTQGAAVP